MKTLLPLSFFFLLVLLCVCCHADPLPPIYHPLYETTPAGSRTVFGRDAYSRAHPGDCSHAPTQQQLESIGPHDQDGIDADGKTVRYLWVKGTDHDHRIVVQGAGYSYAARAWIAKHWRVGSPAPADAVASAAAHSVQSAPYHAARRASSPLRYEYLPPVVHPINPFAVIAAIVLGLLAAGTLGAVLARRRGAGADGS